MTRSRIQSLVPPTLVSPVDASYPEPLRDLDDPPTPLRFVGRLPPLGAAAVAVVGTRHPSDEAGEFTFRLAADLAQLGVTVVSGGALGIDAAAHRGAMAGGGKTVVVLASGLRTAYPARHAPLFSEILSGGHGALVSEAPDSWAPHPGLFLRRNRIIAGLSASTVVVQAAHRSGALSTARSAISLGRRVFSVPGSPWDPRADGTLALLARGAEICTSARDVLSLRPASAPEVDSGNSECIKNSCDVEGLGGEKGDLFRCLQQNPAHPDRIARELDIPSDRVQELLLALELSGLIARRIDGTYGVSTHLDSQWTAGK